MASTLYHGTTQKLCTLKSGSWLTKLPTHALTQAESRGKKQHEEPWVIEVHADDSDVRKPEPRDRTPENYLNTSKDEEWVFISTRDLPVVRSFSHSEAKKTFCGPQNLLPSTKNG